MEKLAPQKAVRDLINVIKSPVLLNPQAFARQGELISDQWCLHEIQTYHEQLAKLCAEPIVLDQYLQKNLKNYRLGYYFETLIGFWFREVKKIDRVYSNLPVRGLQQTLGEFDLIYGDESCESGTHLEMAIKFYLCLTTEDHKGVTLGSYVGPNAKDRLDLKVARLMNRQMKLGSTEEGRKELMGIGFKQIQSIAFVKGTLFYPLESDWKNHQAPQEVSVHHERGWWSHVSKWIGYHKTVDSNIVWAILNRNEWITPELESYMPQDRMLSGPDLLNFLMSHFNEGKPSIMVAEFEVKSKHQHLFRSKGFIVSDAWPLLS